jgi:hypothetical protein
MSCKQRVKNWRAMTFVDNSLSSWFSLVFAIVVCHMARHAGVEVIEMKPSDYQIQNDLLSADHRLIGIPL